jgi:hypothetical protein
MNLSKGWNRGCVREDMTVLGVSINSARSSFVAEVVAASRHDTVFRSSR